MSEENTQIPAQQPVQNEERTDELDIFGGLLIKLGKYFITLYRNLFKSQQNS